MLDKVRITLSAHHDGGRPGDPREVDPVEARRLIGAGVAVAATKPDARAARVDPEQAATATGS